MSPFNENTLLLLVGLLLLTVNVILGARRLRQGHLRAGVLSVIVALIACVLIAVGVARFAVAVTPQSPTELQSLRGRFLPLLFTAGAGALMTLAGFLIYRRERHQDTFAPSHSFGLLTIGAGAFILIAALVVPTIPLQLSGSLRVSASSTSPTPGGVAPTHVVETSTPTITPTASDTPTPIPSLTPVMTETPLVLYTAIAYSSTYAVDTPTPCNANAKAMLNLRGDPSTRQQAIGRIFAGSLLYVTGRTTDKKWLRVVSANDAARVEGWASVDYVTLDAACESSSIPAFDLAGKPVTAATQAATASATESSTSDATATAPCTLLTNTTSSLRADPSKTQKALAQVPERTALTATAKSVDGTWWRVNYAGQDGWIGGGTVIASASCAGVPSVTLTPAP